MLTQCMEQRAGGKGGVTASVGTPLRVRGYRPRAESESGPAGGRGWDLLPNSTAIFIGAAPLMLFAAR